jgi:hypothetical protein
MGFRVSALKGARWFLWLMVIWILVRGVASFLVPPREAPAAVVKDDPAAMAAAAATAIAEREAPGAFAALFAREYLTVTPGAESQRSARLAPMILAGRFSPSVSLPTGTDFVGQTVGGTWPYRVENVGESTWLVTVAAKVTTQMAQSAAERFIYVAVPVLSGPSGYVVYDYPTVVPAPVSAGMQAPAAPGDVITDPNGQIRNLVAGFMKAYAAGSASDVTYFVEPGSAVQGLAGSQVYVEIAELTVRKNGSDVWADALVSMQDPISKIVTRQRYTLQVVERESRWYVKQILQKGA